MSCRLKKAIGSGYSKPCNPGATKEIDQAVAKLKEARDALDAKYYPQAVNVMQRTDPPDFSNSLVSTSSKR
jgi:hypothetical protein